MQFEVITIGAAVQDVFIQSPIFSVRAGHPAEACFPWGEKVELEQPVFSTGGGATNAAATFGHLGFATACIAKVGHDTAAQAIVRDLHEHGVHSDLLVRSEQEQTGYSLLLSTPNGQRTAMVYRGASQTLTPKDIPWDRLHSRWIYVTSLGGNLALVKRLFAFAAKQNIRVAWNPGMVDLTQKPALAQSLVGQTDLVSLNLEEAARLANTIPSDLQGILRTLRPLLGRYLLLTAGPKGTYFVTHDLCLFSPASPVPVVNVTGAGDAAGSGCVAGLLQYDEDMSMALRLSVLNAESVIGAVGAKNGLLTRWPGTRVLSRIPVTHVPLQKS